MSYEQSMEIAGADVILFQEFGSYQGEWWAKVEYNGIKGWVNGSYGSCSGCDSFQAEFWSDDHEGKDGNYHMPLYDGFVDGCESCNQFKARLAAFGKGYLDFIMTQEDAEKSASANLEWDYDAQAMVDFIKNNSWNKTSIL